MTDATVIGNKGNLLFHVDSSFNARRAGHSLLLAHRLPPKGTGGETEFSDSRTAYEDLSDEMKTRVDNLVGNHSLFHSRKTAMPEYFKDLDVTKLPMSKHRLVQKHEWSGRMVSGLDDAAEIELVHCLVCPSPGRRSQGRVGCHSCRASRARLQAKVSRSDPLGTRRRHDYMGQVSYHRGFG